MTFKNDKRALNAYIGYSYETLINSIYSWI